MIRITTSVDPAGDGTARVTVHAGQRQAGPAPCGVLTMGEAEAAELAARVRAGDIEVEITQAVAAHVLWHYGLPGGMEPGSFTKPFIAAIVAADRENTARLARVYPAHVLAVQLARDVEDGIHLLQALAGRLVAEGGAAR
ncbi:hypothetical protein ACFOWE_31275 [Planomonospora corallina]|uniref:Uncharacterized protein n=1 Tax=Planomonospora corallina TaxID=1806052 RepID=A0ABV8IFY0_9ACTN